MSLRVGHVNVTCFSVTDKFVSQTSAILKPKSRSCIYFFPENGFRVTLLCMQYCEKPRAVTLRDGISVTNKSLFRLYLIP